MSINFSPKDDAVRRFVLTRFEELIRRPVGAFERWSEQIRKSCGVDPKTRSPVQENVARTWRITLPEDGDAGGRLLFAIQTFFAGVVKQTARWELGGFETEDRFFDWAETMDEELPFVPFSRDSRDRFGPVYQRLYPASARKSLGEFYTPDALAAFLFRQLDPSDSPILDPGCGSGIFLLAAADFFREAGQDSESILRKIRGFDLNPLAVLMAKVNLALMLGIRSSAEIPVFLRDSILEEPTLEERGRFRILGNPPWLNWDRLPKDYREETRPLWQRYGLFNLSGNEARHGGAKKELAQLMLLRVADGFLQDGARLAMILPFSMFQTRKSGEGFRRFQLPDETPLGVLRVDDLSGLRKNPFGNIGTSAATLLLQKGRTTEYPVPIFRWKRLPETGVLQPKPAFTEPIDASRPGSHWVIRSESKSTAPVDLGPSDYQGYLGANTGGANGVFWLEILGPSKTSSRRIRVRNLSECGKRPLPTIEAEIEKDLVYPLLCWGDVDRFETKSPGRFILLPQDVDRRTGWPEELFRRNWPETFKYLKRFETVLRERAAYRKYQDKAPFYSMYNVGPQTLAPIKVVWRRMDSMLRAARLETLDHPLLGRKPVVPQETCVLIPCRSSEEADHLVGRLNSPEIDEIVRSFSAVGSKGFGSPGILNHLGLRRFQE